MAKRASASSSSGQPSQSKRPCVAPTENLVLGSCSTEEDDAQRVCGEELEPAKSHSTEYCQSCTGNALKDIAQLMHSMENSIQELVRQELERAMPRLAEYFQSCIWNALKDKMQQVPLMENDFQRLTKVELGNSHSTHLRRANAESTAKNEARILQLQFQTKLSLPLYTGKKIKGEEGARIIVAVINVNTGDIVTSGLESSIKLDVVVLEGDFNKDNEDNWAPEEFENYVAKERAGKGPLLTGDLIVKLKGGVGELGDLIFTDNSSWNRNKEFRIGLKVASGYCGNTRIQEAVTDAFRVKEHRGELHKKHYPPASDDEVWRLEKIAKNGKLLQKLSDAGIHKVEDFLLQLFTDSKKLKEILGKSIIPKNWDILVDHAKTCKIDRKLYLYYSDGMRKHGAVFNTDRQLIGLIKDRAYFTTHRLSAQEKEDGNTIVKKALDNWNDVREFNDETFSGSMQKKSSSSFQSHVLQIQNLTPVQHNLVPRVCATPGGLEATPEDVGFTAEGHGGATASALPQQLQNTNSGNAMKLSVDESGCLAEQQPISTGPLNVLISQGDIHSSSQMHHAVNENAPPEGNHLMENWPPYDDMDYLFALLPYDDELFKTPLYDGGSVSGTSRGVIGWLKIKAVMRWGFFIRKIVTKKRGIMVQPPIEVQA